MCKSQSRVEDKHLRFVTQTDDGGRVKFTTKTQPTHGPDQTIEDKTLYRRVLSSRLDPFSASALSEYKEIKPAFAKR